MQLWPGSEITAPTEDGRFRRMVIQQARVRAGLLRYAAGDTVPEHAHRESDEIFFVVSGRPTFVIDGRPVAVERGSLLHVSAGEVHGIVVGDEPLLLLAAVSPNLDDAWHPVDGQAAAPTETA